MPETNPPTEHKQKYGLEEVKKFSPVLLNKIIGRLREYLKTDKVMLQVFEDYDVPIDEIATIPMAFDDIDVSARTEHGIIFFNYRLLCDGDFYRDFGYGVHEITHYLQQTTGTQPTKGADDGSYLDNEYEVEGFQNQIEWIAETFGDKESDEYVDDMLSYHDLKGNEKKEKKEELTEKVESTE
jgi:hypothetical protein